MVKPTYCAKSVNLCEMHSTSKNERVRLIVD